MQDIVNLPPGTVTDKFRLEKESNLIDILRIEYGSMTRFVIRHVKKGKVLSFRQTDEFTKVLADSWIQEYVELLQTNEQYKLQQQ